MTRVRLLVTSVLLALVAAVPAGASAPPRAGGPTPAQCRAFAERLHAATDRVEVATLTRACNDAGVRVTAASDPGPCPVLKSMAGAYGPFFITSEGDVYSVFIVIDENWNIYIVVVKWWDCPPYDS